MLSHELLTKDRLAVTIGAIGPRRVSDARVHRRGDGCVSANALAKSRSNHVDALELIGQLLAVPGTIEIEMAARLERESAVREGRGGRSSHRRGTGRHGGENNDEQRTTHIAIVRKLCANGPSVNRGV